MRLNTLKNALALTFAFLLGTNAFAQACSDNFTVTGNLITGTTYKSYVELPAIPSDSAWQAAYAQIAKDGWKIERADKSAGIINSQNVNATRPMPMNVVVEKQGNGSKVSITYYTPPAASSPQDVVRKFFCTTLTAASNVTSSVQVASSPQSASPAIPQAANNEYSKNGLPCVAEICIGDGLNELAKIKWDKAQESTYGMTKGPVYTSSIKPTTLEIQTLSKIWKGNIAPVAKYLPQVSVLPGKLDGDSVKSLSAITATCSQVGLVGSFISSGGNLTSVAIRLKSWDKDFSNQNWTVVGITRFFQTAISDTQKNELQKQLDQRYKSFIYPFETSVKVGLGSYEMTLAPLGGHVAYALVLGRNVESNDRERLARHPYCGGSEKVNLD